MCRPKANNNSRINSTNTFEFNATMSTGSYTKLYTEEETKFFSDFVDSFEHEAVESVSPLHQENVMDPPPSMNPFDFVPIPSQEPVVAESPSPSPPPVPEESAAPTESLPSNGSLGAVECVDCLAIPASLALFFTLRRPLAGLRHKTRKLNKKHKHPRPPHHLLLPLMGKRSSPKPRPYPTRSSSTSLPEFKQDR